MPKGRGSNERGRSRRLAHRSGGSAAGTTRKQWMEMKQLTALWRRNPDTWRLSGSPGFTVADRVPLWHRLVEKIRRGVWVVHTSVAPRSASRKLEAMAQKRAVAHMRAMPTIQVKQVTHRRQSSRRRG